MYSLQKEFFTLFINFSKVLSVLHFHPKFYLYNPSFDEQQSCDILIEIMSNKNSKLRGSDILEIQNPNNQSLFHQICRTLNQDLRCHHIVVS